MGNYVAMRGKVTFKSGLVEILRPRFTYDENGNHAHWYELSLPPELTDSVAYRALVLADGEYFTPGDYKSASALFERRLEDSEGFYDPAPEEMMHLSNEGVMSFLTSLKSYEAQYWFLMILPLIATSWHIEQDFYEIHFNDSKSWETYNSEDQCYMKDLEFKLMKEEQSWISSINERYNKFMEDKKKG